MIMNEKNLKPASVFYYFEEICKVPRPSKREEKIIAYLKAFGREHGLETKTDEVGNVLIKKPATPGKENLKTVILQSHIDMVCEKNSDVEHDFLIDPIETVVDGEWLKAKGTTLGADNGIGVATELAILAATDIEHGPLECLFTVDEETGLTGAFALKPGFMTGDILINLDSEDEGELFIGCAGGANTTAEFTYQPVSVITYSFYSVYSDLFDLSEKKIPLKEDFSIDINNYKNLDSGIIIANPNAPTGLLLELNEIEEIIKTNLNNIVIIDEAYIDFGGESAIKLINKYDNLLVIQTFSKSRSLAGMRLGFAIGNKELIKGLKNIKFSFNSYTINRLSILAGIEAFKDEEYFKESVSKIINTREKTKEELKKLGFKILDSKSNFLFISHNKIFGENIYLKLKDKGILVRYFKKEIINNFIRVTIGTYEEMIIFINALKEIIN